MTTEPSRREPANHPEPQPNGQPVRVVKREWAADVMVAIGIGAFASFYLLRALV
jgi:hypothetical protein